MTVSYKLVVCYDGTRYNGFQRQAASTSTPHQPPPKRPRYDANGRKLRTTITIQECLEDAICLWMSNSKLNLADLRMRAAGRTDTGVHARGQVVAIDLEAPLDVPDWQAVKAINSRLPDDISVNSLEPCRKTFEPRQEATRKQYSYTVRYRRKVMDGEGKELDVSQRGGVHTIRTALDSPVLWLCPWSLNDANLQNLCHAMVGEHDFTAFCHKEERRSGRSHVMRLEKFQANILTTTSSQSEKDDVVTVKFVMEAKGFRRGMCRNLVGFVVDYCRGQISPSADGGHEQALQEVWKATEEVAKLVHSAPASGLCLEHVWF